MRFHLPRPPSEGRDPARASALSNSPTPIEVDRHGTARDLPLRGQATASDARAERMVRRLRGDVNELRAALAGIAAGQQELLEVTPAAVVENPRAAVALAPAVLIRSLKTAAATEQELRDRLATREAEISALRHQLAKLREDHAHDRGRLETLEQVLGALHANLEDLRAERQQLRHAEPRGLLPESAPGD